MKVLHSMYAQKWLLDTTSVSTEQTRQISLQSISAFYVRKLTLGRLKIYFTYNKHPPTFNQSLILYFLSEQKSMQKYRVYEKLKKTKYCSYYNAEDINTKELVTIKKMSYCINWNQLLKRKQIILMKSGKYPFLAKVKELVQQNSKFYMVFEPLGQNLQDIRNNRNYNFEKIINLSEAMIQTVEKLHEENILPTELRSEFWFVSNNQLKLAHLQSTEKSKDLSSLKLIDNQDFKYTAPQVVMTSNPIQKASNTFSLGCIIAQMILGKTLIYAKTKMDYIYILCNLFPRQDIDFNGYEHKSKIKFSEQKSFDSILKGFNIPADLVKVLSGMLRVNPNERLSLQQVFKRIKQLYAKRITPKKSVNIDKLGNNEKLNKSIKKSRSASKSRSKSRSPSKLKQNNRKQSLKKKSPGKLKKDSKLFLSFSVENDPITEVSILPTLPRYSKPLKYQRNTKDNTSHSFTTKKYQLHKRNTAIKIPQIRKHSNSRSGSVRKKTKTHFIKPILTPSSATHNYQFAYPQLTNYALFKTRDLSMNETTFMSESQK